MRKFTFTIICSIIMTSCLKEANPVIIDLNKSYIAGPGVFVLNEGNFKSGNGSLSFFSYDSLKLFNHVFLDINQRPLGDVPYSMNIGGNTAYIVVNNSGKIEVVNRSDLKSVATISGIISPRYISLINDTKAYVTSLYSDSLTIIDLSYNSISGYIDLKKTSEAIVTLYSTAYVANWAGGNKIMIINTANDMVTDSIEVGAEPESMVIDKNETLWVLCNGGWKREFFAELIAINTRTKKIERRFTFPSINDSPTCLQIDKAGEIMYFLLNGVKRISINAEQLPSETFIPNLGRSFYKVGINPSNNEVFITDACDYVQKGYLLRYTAGGTLLSEMQADIVPGGFCFKLSPDYYTD